MVKIFYDKEHEKKKRRRTDGGKDDDASQRINLQLSPFSPTGKFKTNPNMDLHYQVDLPKCTDMTGYKRFVRKLPLPLSQASPRKLAEALTRQQSMAPSTSLETSYMPPTIQASSGNGPVEPRN